MTSFQLWAHLAAYGEMSSVDWYRSWVTPLAIVAFCAFPLMIFALRRVYVPAWIAALLFLALLPAALMLPAFYVRLNLPGALAWLGVAMPASALDIPAELARELGAALDTLALLSQIGAGLLPIVLFASGQFGDLGALTTTIRSATHKISETFLSSSNGARKVTGRVLRVVQGSKRGERKPLTHGLSIGRHSGDWTMPKDRVLSGQHVRFTVRGEEVELEDLGSTNGTYVLRDEQRFAIAGSRIALRLGDQVYLGAPEVEHVQLSFEMGDNDTTVVARG